MVERNVHFCLLLLLLIHFPVSSSQAREAWTVAVASSLYPSLQARISHEPEHGKIRLIPGSSGRLYNQILQGAPFDLFIAAGTRYPRLLRARSHAQRRIAQGCIGLRIGNDFVNEPQRLIDHRIRHIAIANPDVAPFGQLARRLLRQADLWTPLRSRLVYARNALQARMMIDRGLVDAAWVAGAPEGFCLGRLEYIAVLLRDVPGLRQWMTRWEAR